MSIFEKICLNFDINVSINTEDGNSQNKKCFLHYLIYGKYLHCVNGGVDVKVEHNKYSQKSKYSQSPAERLISNAMPCVCVRVCVFISNALPCVSE